MADRGREEMSLNTNEWALFVVLGLGLLIPFVIVLREMVSTPKG